MTGSNHPAGREPSVKARHPQHRLGRDQANWAAHPRGRSPGSVTPSGVRALCRSRDVCVMLRSDRTTGKPCAGNPHARFERGSYPHPTDLSAGDSRIYQSLYSVRSHEPGSWLRSGGWDSSRWPTSWESHPRLKAADRELLAESLEWFGRNLDTPTRFNRSKSKGFYRRRTRGIAWFKDLLPEHVARMHQIKSVLERYGHPVVVLTESRVGYVIHDDAFQVIAEPFSDTQTG